MNKGIKIILSTLSTIILTLIILPVVISLVLYLPAVQGFMVRRVTNYLSERAQTTISIDRVQLKLFNRVAVEGLYVEDYHGDTLLYARQLVVPVTQLNPFTGMFGLGAVRIEYPTFYLMQDSTGVTNLAQLLAHFKREKKPNPKPFRLRAGSMQVNNMAFKYLKHDRREREYGVNFTDLDVRDFYLEGHDIEVIGDSISLSIDNIALREKSGLVIDRLAAKEFSISSRGMYFDRLSLLTPASQVALTYLNFGYRDWQDYKNFIDSVPIESEIVSSTVSFQTIAYFAPGLRDRETTLTEVSGTVNGTIAALTGNITKARARDTEISVRFGIFGLPDIAATRFDLHMPSLATNSRDIQFIAKDIAHKALESNVIRYLDKAGNIRFSGSFDGVLSSFGADGVLRTDQGTVNLKLNINPLAHHRTAFRGYLQAHGFDAGNLLSVKKLERVSLQANVTGEMGGNDMTLDAGVVIPGLTYNDYTYDSIRLNGVFDNRKFTGAISSPDPNMAFDFNGELDFNGTLPAYNFSLSLHNADLHKLHFNRRDTVSVIRGDITASGEGTTLDNINATVDIGKLTYINHIDTVRTDKIRFIARNSQESKELAMYSSFADAEFRGHASYNHMISYFRNTLLSYLPSIETGKEIFGGGEASANPATAGTRVRPATESDGTTKIAANDVRNYYIVRLNVKEANNVAGIFLPGLQLAEGTKLSFLFNPDNDVFSLTANSDYIERGNFYVSKLNINGQNQADSISLFVQAEEVYGNGVFLPNFSVVGGAKENRISLATRFNNKETGTYAMLSTVSTLGRNPETGIPQLSVRFSPSTLTNNDRTWAIASREIVWDSTRIFVDAFNIVNGDQRLTINGTASKHRTDTIKLRLNRFNLAPLSQISQPKGYRIGGVTNGYVDMVSALREGVMNARVTFDSMSVNDIPFRSTTFESTWDFAEAQARMKLSDTRRGDTIFTGYYRPQDNNFRGYLTMKDIDLSLLDPLLSGVITRTKGTASARLTLTNPNKRLEINGEIDVDSISTLVDYTKVPYTLRRAKGDVKNNVLTIRPVRAYDPMGNSAPFEMTLDATNFRNLAYNIHVRPERMLVLNTTYKDNDLFYGNIYASGAATIKGNKAGVSMDIVATTQNGSQFFMPLSNTSVSEADFVVFESPAQRAAADSVASLRNRRRLTARLKERQTMRGNMDIKLALNVRPNTELQLNIDAEEDNVLHGRGNGTLNLHVNPNNNIFTIYGDYDITDGEYKFSLRNLISRDFSISPGSSIQWTGDPMDALLNITAEYKLKASPAPLLRDMNRNFRSNIPVNCIIRLTDRLTQPTITFDVQVPSTDSELQAAISNAMNTQEMVATQFIWLVAINNFYSDNTGNNSNMNIGAMGGTVTGVEFLSSQLSSWLSTDRFSLVPKYRPKSELTSDEVGLAFSAELIKDRLSVEVDGSYDTGNNVTQTANSITGDVYMNLTLDRTGNFKAKAFTRTVDRFDENQGLQESGIGLSYRENFNRFGDLGKIFRERFANIGRRRRERKAAEAAELQRLAAQEPAAASMQDAPQVTSTGQKGQEAQE